MKENLINNENEALVVCDFSCIQLESTDLQDFIVVLYQAINNKVVLYIHSLLMAILGGWYLLSFYIQSAK